MKRKKRRPRTKKWEERNTKEIDRLRREWQFVKVKMLLCEAVQIMDCLRQTSGRTVASS